jgi:NAD(P)-dependent dehydrogenase (short-subunit alcohol dehydrogenase family)
MRFASKIAVITGGGTGIGRAAAEALVHEGAKVVINGRRENVLAATAKAIDPSGRSVAAHAGDIGRPETAAAIVSLAQQRFGGVDILMNNAGIFAPKPFMDHTEDDFDRFVATILKGKFFMAQAAAGAMKARGGGAIVQTGSLWALQAIAATPSAAYTRWSKILRSSCRRAALINLASEHPRSGGTGVQVTLVAGARFVQGRTSAELRKFV